MNSASLFSKHWRATQGDSFSLCSPSPPAPCNPCPIYERTAAPLDPSPSRWGWWPSGGAVPSSTVFTRRSGRRSTGASSTLAFLHGGLASLINPKVLADSGNSIRFQKDKTVCKVGLEDAAVKKAALFFCFVFWELAGFLSLNKANSLNACR